MINGKFPAQLIAMVSDELKADLRAEADRREVSISQVAREHIEAGKRYLAELERLPQRHLLGAPVEVDGVSYPDADTARDAVEQMERNRLDAIEDEDADDGPSLAELAAKLGPDTEADEVDGILAARHLDSHEPPVFARPPSLRVAARKPRGIT